MTNEGKLFKIYSDELIEWNKKFNLTAITDPEEVRIKHFEDSLSLLEPIRLTTQSLIDIGAGAGFPGIPLKIKCPQIQLTLVEATRKKVDFLRYIIEKLGLKDIEVIWGRAEEISKDKRERYDIAVSRAVANLNILSELCLPFVKVGGYFIAYKGEKIEAEVKESENAIKLLGGKLKEIKNVQLPNSDIVRSLVIIEKISPTPEKYPRRPGMANKRPL